MTVRTFRAVAIVSVYNERDVLEQTTRDLIEQGINVHIIDNGSTDGSAETVRHLVGSGVIGIERLPDDGKGEPPRFRLRRILARKEELARTLDADWFINHDADELREAPWPAVRLADALALVDRLGWNAVDFEVFNFRPTHDGYRAGNDLRTSFRYAERVTAGNRAQIRCWKRGPAVDLVSSGGHEARFDGQNVFPIRFLLRHYPIRTQAHGERKVFHERQPRFDPDEIASGWHVQYADARPGMRFIRDPSAMTPFDLEAARVQLMVNHRALEEEVMTRLSLEERQRQLDGLFVETQRTLESEIATRRRLEGEVRTLQARLDEMVSANARKLERA